MTRCEGLLDPTDVRFLKRHLPKRPPQGLDSVLREMLATLPVNLEPDLDNCALVTAMREENDEIRTTFDAMRIARNDLSHGNKTYEQSALREVADILERVVRGHLLRLLRASNDAVTRVLSPEH